MASKKLPAPVKTKMKLHPVSKTWVTGDEALDFIFSADETEFAVIVEDDEDGTSIQLAIELEQIDEAIKILGEIKAVALRYLGGEAIPSDPIDDGAGEDIDDSDEEDDDEDDEDD